MSYVVARSGGSPHRPCKVWALPAQPLRRPLTWFGIGLTGVLLMQALSLVGHLHDLYGRHGIVDWSVTWDSPAPGVPNLAWLDRALSIVGMPATAAVPLAFAIYSGSLL